MKRGILMLCVLFKNYHHNCSIVKISLCTLLKEVVSWETPQTDHPTGEDGAGQHLWVRVPSSSCSSSHLGAWDWPQDALHPCWWLLCFGERVRELSSGSTWGPLLAHPPDLLLLLGGPRCTLRLLLHFSAQRGAAGIFTLCDSVAFPRIIHNVSEAVGRKHLACLKKSF